MTYYFQVNRSHVTETVLQAYLIKTENLPVTSHFPVVQGSLQVLHWL